MNPIAEYLEQLSRLLRRRRRRRILDEVQAHLLDAAAADPLARVDPPAAARRAVERFGSPARVAGEFNAVRAGGARARRSLAVTLVAATMASVGTATVWALEPAAAHTVAHAHARVHHHVHRHTAHLRHHRGRR